MHSKLIAVGAGIFGLGALMSWAVTADHYELKMKRNHELLNHMLTRQSKELRELRTNLVRATQFDPAGEWPELTTQAVEEAKAATVAFIEKHASEEVVSVEPVADGVEITTALAPESVVETDSEKSPGGVVDEAEGDEPYNELIFEERRGRLQNLINTYAADPEAVDTFVARAGAELEHAKHTPPFVISRELYASDPDEGDEYAKITLMWYEKDRILVDDEEDVIEDVEQYVGYRSLARFGDESGDADVVFVRNRRLLTDFEVVREVDEDPPAHVRYGMSRDEFRANKAAGVIKFRDEDRD